MSNPDSANAQEATGTAGLTEARGPTAAYSPASSETYNHKVGIARQTLIDAAYSLTTDLPAATGPTGLMNALAMAAAAPLKDEMAPTGLLGVIGATAADGTWDEFATAVTDLAPAP